MSACKRILARAASSLEFLHAVSSLIAYSFDILHSNAKPTNDPMVCQSSPRAGKVSPPARKPGAGEAKVTGRVYRRAAPATTSKRMLEGVRVPLDAFEKPFAGGTELDALPGRLESLLFPERYLVRREDIN